MKKVIRAKDGIRLVVGLILLSMLLPQLIGCGIFDMLGGSDESDTVNTEEETSDVEIPQDFMLNTAAGFMMSKSSLPRHAYP